MGKVKMELNEAVNAYMAWQSLSNASRLGWELSWEIDDIVEACEKHKERHQKEADGFLKAFGEPIDGQAGRYNLIPDKADDYKLAMETLSKQEVTVDFEPIPFEKLEASGIKVLGNEMRALKNFIVRAPKPVEMKSDKGKKEKEINDKVAASSKD